MPASRDGQLLSPLSPVSYHPAQAITQATSILHTNGWAEPRTTVRLYDDSVHVASVEAGAEGRWSAPLSLVDGTHVLTAMATDYLGQISPPGTAGAVTVDTRAPLPSAVPLT